MYMNVRIEKFCDLQEKDNFNRQDVEAVILSEKPSPIRFECYNDMIKKANKFSVGSEVEVHFYIKGNRSKEGKVFNNLVITDIKELSN